MKAKDRNQGDDAPLDQQLADLHGLIDDIEVAMMTTRRHDGELVSRPMQTQKRDEAADLWFVTSTDTHKLDELDQDPHVNLAYLRRHGSDWVSVSGVARVSRDRALIHRLYSKSWRAWFGDAGGARDGGPDDPRIALVLVEAHSAVYLKQTHSQPVVLFQVARGALTGKPPKTGELRHLGGTDLHRPH